MSSRPVKVERSAGGVVLLDPPQTRQVLLIATLSPAGEQRWQLPKGALNRDESEEVAALREVGEETGIYAEIIRLIDIVEYWFYDRRAAVRIHKYVSFYLMRYLSGHPTPQESEVEDARWMPVPDALRSLSFENERRIVERALQIANTP